MSFPYRRPALSLLALLAGLAGCSGNYRFDDDEYRPVGAPMSRTAPPGERA